jgi:hypothetical protein
MIKLFDVFNGMVQFVRTGEAGNVERIRGVTRNALGTESDAAGCCRVSLPLLLR